MDNKDHPINIAETRPQNSEFSTKMRSRIDLKSDRYLTNTVSLDDEKFVKILDQVVADINESSQSPSLEDIGTALRKWNKDRIAKLPNQEMSIDENRKPLSERLKVNDKPLVGEWIDSNANLCQQNCLLLEATAAYFGYKTSLRSFDYIGKSSGELRSHIVVEAEDPLGQKVVMDPTLLVPTYGNDIGYVDKQEYFSRFLQPDVGSEKIIFEPKSVVPKPSRDFNS